MRVGFSGTRSEITLAQAASLRRVLEELQPSHNDEAHHGDCQGADVAFYHAATDLGMWTVAHPSDHLLRAFTNSRAILPVKKPMARNRDIVVVSDVMVTCPGSAETRRSGTWGTIRFTRKMLRPLTLIWPDGRIEIERA